MDFKINSKTSEQISSCVGSILWSLFYFIVGVLIAVHCFRSCERDDIRIHQRKLIEQQYGEILKYNN